MIFATIERVEIVDEAEKLAKMIIQSELAEEYRHCVYKLRNDQEAQNIIKNFVKLKDLYDEVQRFGRYHPEYKTVTKQMRQLKRTLDLHDSVAELRKAETALQGLLDEIAILIARSVSDQIKVPTGNPFFDSHSGGCGAGGSCGC